MLEVLAIPVYRQLFFAQVISLLGTGLATVALGLMAFEIAGDKAGEVLGTALTIKMLAYVFVSPLLSAVLQSLPRKKVLIVLDLARALTALSLPFVSEVWQVYLLIFVLQCASAGFTPLFQSTIPDILRDPKDYSRALSLSRLAYDLESLASPIIAAALLLITSWHGLFSGTVFGFLASAMLVGRVVLPPQPDAPKVSRRQLLVRGMVIYFRTPRLQGMLMLGLAAALLGSMVFVNTVVLVQGAMDLPETFTAIALAVFGGGSMTVALLLPRFYEQWSDRSLMLSGCVIAGISLGAGLFVTDYGFLLVMWLLAGVGYSLVQTPSSRVLIRSCHAEDKLSLFAAHFSLSHLGWMLAYPSAGWLMSLLGPANSFGIFALLTLLAGGAAVWLWPSELTDTLEHDHPDLEELHPHLNGSRRHRHTYVIDDLHTHWPK